MCLFALWLGSRPATGIRWLEHLGEEGRKPQPEQISRAAQLPSLKLCLEELKELLQGSIFLLFCFKI